MMMMWLSILGGLLLAGFSFRKRIKKALTSKDDKALQAAAEEMWREDPRDSVAEVVAEVERLEAEENVRRIAADAKARRIETEANLRHILAETEARDRRIAAETEAKPLDSKEKNRIIQSYLENGDIQAKAQEENHRIEVEAQEGNYGYEIVAEENGLFAMEVAELDHRFKVDVEAAKRESTEKKVYWPLRSIEIDRKGRKHITRFSCGHILLWCGASTYEEGVNKVNKKGRGLKKRCQECYREGL